MANWATKSKNDSTPLPLIGTPQVYASVNGDALVTLKYEIGGKQLIWLDNASRLALIEALKVADKMKNPPVSCDSGGFFGYCFLQFSRAVSNWCEYAFRRSISAVAFATKSSSPAHT